jgi:hypothetical protein
MPPAVGGFPSTRGGVTAVAILVESTTASHPRPVAPCSGGAGGAPAIAGSGPAACGRRHFATGTCASADRSWRAYTSGRQGLDAHDVGRLLARKLDARILAARRVTCRPCSCDIVAQSNPEMTPVAKESPAGAAGADGVGRAKFPVVEDNRGRAGFGEPLESRSRYISLRVRPKSISAFADSS